MSTFFTDMKFKVLKTLPWYSTDDLFSFTLAVLGAAEAVDDYLATFIEEKKFC